MEKQCINKVVLSYLWIAPFEKGSLTGVCKKQELKQFDMEISHHCTSSLMAFISIAATIQITAPLPSTMRRLAKLLRTHTEQLPRM